MLVARAGQLIEKDNLLRKVWPDRFFEEANLTQCIFAWRRALRENYRASVGVPPDPVVLFNRRPVVAVLLLNE
jgi:hypothetical protein